MRALDLFCGAGGASLGLHRAGYDVTGHDYWARAVETHVANGLPAVVHDLSDPDMDHLLPECDLLWASPPCQPFSAAGDQAGEFDDRDGFPWLLRIVARLLPPVCLIENVKGLTFQTHADYFGRVLEQFTRLGYVWQWRVLNSADYGVPQTRERCFIVARRDGGPIVWPAPTHTQGDSLFLEPWVTMAQALGWDGERCPWDTTTIPAPTVHRNSAKDWLGNNTIAGGPLAERDPATEPAMTVGTRGDLWRWVLDHRQTGGDGTPVIVDVTDRPSPTVGTMAAGQWVINGAIRLTIAELATLQGFPPDWQWCGTKTDQARQVGNAVCPVMAERLAAANRPIGVPA
jgi:DNA (cytosine-5)-methyltransferase 1